MQLSILLTIAATLASASADDSYRIIGSTIFGRHGDREAKPATYLTPLGATQMFNVGQFFRHRYFGLDSSNNKTLNAFNDDGKTLIQGLDKEGYWIENQLYAETAQSNILITSHYAFLQGLYPPLDIDDNSQMVDLTLAGLSNGTLVDNPLSGYQYAKSNIQQNATDNFIWIKGDENCPVLSKSIKNVKSSDLFYQYGNQSKSFLQSLYDIEFIQEKFTKEKLNFGNSMNIFDAVLVGTVHNETIAKQFNESTIAEIKYWANLYQWTISNKHTDPELNIGAQTLVAKILKQLNTTRTKNTPFITYMTGSYNNMFQLSSLLDLYAQNERFYTMPSYASSYVFELLANQDNETFVRFSFKNGTDEVGPEINSYPLFNNTEVIIPWDQFERQASAVAIKNVESWCQSCGILDMPADAILDMCVPYSNLYTAAKTLQAEGVDLKTVKKNKSSLSLADAGGIGAGVTIGVVLILGGLFYIYTRLTKKSKAPILPVASNGTDDSHTEAGSTVGKE